MRPLPGIRPTWSTTRASRCPTAAAGCWCSPSRGRRCCAASGATTSATSRRTGRGSRGALLRRRRRQEGRRRRPVAARPRGRRHERLRPPHLHDRGRVRAGRPPEVAEAAVVGATDPTTGQAIVAFVILRGERRPRTPARSWCRRCATTSASEIGPIAKPRQIMIVPELPKTRSGKIMRRLLRDVAEHRALGDVTTLDRHLGHGPDRGEAARRPRRGLEEVPGRGPGRAARPSCGTIPLTCTAPDPHRPSKEEGPWPAPYRHPRPDGSAGPLEPTIGTLVQSAMADVSTLIRAGELAIRGRKVGQEGGHRRGRFGRSRRRARVLGLLLRHRLRRVPHLSGPGALDLLPDRLGCPRGDRRRGGAVRAWADEEDRKAGAHARDAGEKLPDVLHREAPGERHRDVPEITNGKVQRRGTEHYSV